MDSITFVSNPHLYLLLLSLFTIVLMLIAVKKMTNITKKPKCRWENKR